MSNNDEIECWQDREIKFDISINDLKPRRGEIEIDSINAVEDTKGNNGEKGALSVTNIRIIWISHINPKINLSIGLSCVTSAKVETITSKLRGNIEGLCVMTKYNRNRFEFLFTSLVNRSPRLFTSVQHVFRSFQTTYLYRNVKLRGAIINDKQLLLLPDEQIYQHVKGVWNLSSDQGNLGTLFITNIRMVWHANMAENFNVSIPYLQIATLKVRASKFGHALVVETTTNGGGYVLGFRIDPEETLIEVHKLLKKLHQLYAMEPVFGVSFRLEEQTTSLKQLTVPPKQDDIEYTDAKDSYDPLSAYLADTNQQNQAKQPIFSKELGLAVEKLPDGFNIEQLWQVKTISI